MLSIEHPRYYNNGTDDPYYFLYYGDAARYPSYFALELEQPEVGRVLRFDSLSKILSSGIRIGFASGPEPLLQALDMHVRTASALLPCEGLKVPCCANRLLWRIFKLPRSHKQSPIPSLMRGATMGSRRIRRRYRGSTVRSATCSSAQCAGI